MNPILFQQVSLLLKLARVSFCCNQDPPLLGPSWLSFSLTSKAPAAQRIDLTGENYCVNSRQRGKLSDVVMKQRGVYGPQTDDVLAFTARAGSRQNLQADRFIILVA